MALPILQMLGKSQMFIIRIIIFTGSLSHAELIVQSNLPDIHEDPNQAPHSNTHYPLQARQRNHPPGMFQLKQVF